MIWSSCFEPVPPILNWFGVPALTASMYSLAALKGALALTHRMNSSSASIATGVISSHLNGTPRRERGREQVGEGDDDLVRVARRSLHVEEALGAGAAGLVDD